MAMDNAKMNKAGTIRKVLSYMKRYIPLLVISLALSVVTVALTLYFPILTGRAIDLIVGKGKVDFIGYDSHPHESCNNSRHSGSSPVAYKYLQQQDDLQHSEGYKA